MKGWILAYSLSSYVGNMSDTWPPGAHDVLRKLDPKISQSRATLIVLSGISDGDWPAAIRFLVGSGRAKMVGQKRGTVYLLETDTASVAKQVPGFTGRHIAAQEHHDTIANVLHELAGDSTCPIIENTSKKRRLPIIAETIERTPASASSIKSAPEIIDRTPPGLERIKLSLQKRGVRVFIDHRIRNGALWIIDGLGVPSVVLQVAKELGVSFHYNPEGGRATKGKAAWWTKDQ